MAAGDSLRKLANDTHTAAQDRRVKIQQESQSLIDMRKSLGDTQRILIQTKKEIDEKNQLVRKMETYIVEMNRRISNAAYTLKGWETDAVNLERQASEMRQRATQFDKNEHETNNQPPLPSM